MHDSGKRQEFNTGAVRDMADNKPRPDLISPYAQMRKGEWLRLGAQKYKERNWEAGIPISRCIASLERHLQLYKMGKLDEDHLAAIAVNCEFIMHFEAMIKKGLLPKDLDDMPKYEQQINNNVTYFHCNNCGQEFYLLPYDNHCICGSSDFKKVRNKP